MKNNLILNVQNFKKLFRSIFIVGVLFVTGFVSARAARSGSGQVPQAVKPTSVPVATPKPTPLVTPTPAPTGAVQLAPVQSSRYLPSAPIMSPRDRLPIDQVKPQQAPEEWVTAVLAHPVPWSNDVKAWADKNWDAFSPEQQFRINQNYAQRMQLLESQQKFVQGPVQSEVRPEDQQKEETLFDSQSYLMQFLSKTGLSRDGQIALAAAGGTVAATAAAIFLGPTIAGYIGLQGALSLAGGSVALSKIGYAYRNKALTEAGAIERVKNILEQKINDTGMYPTYAMQIEALNNNRDFVNNGQVDDHIFKLACQQLAEQILKDSRMGLADKKESLKQDQINNAIRELRKELGSVNIKEYVKNLENTHDSNKYRAYVSEYMRAKNIVAIAAEKALQERRRTKQGEQPQILTKEQPKSVGQPEKKSMLDQLMKSLSRQPLSRQ